MYEYLSSKQGGQPVEPYVAMVCLLVREGANLKATTGLFGFDVMNLCPPDVAPLIYQIEAEARR